MTILIFDIEANGLLDSISKVHCLVIINADTKTVYKFHDDPNITRSGDILDGIIMLNSADVLVGHNIIGYDLPALSKMYPGFKPKAYHDTFILSQMFYPNEMMKHGLEAWGKIFDMPKPQHEDWSTFSEAMLERCVIDTRITFNLWRNCKREMDSWNWTTAIQTEYKLYEVYSKHMTHWYMDVEKLDNAIEFLNSEIDRLTSYLSMHTPIRRRIIAEDVPYLTKTKIVSARAKKYAGDDIAQYVGDFCVVKFEKLNLNSTSQIVQWLLSIGWKPDTFNYKLGPNGKPLKENGELVVTGPSLRDSSFIGVPDEIRDYLIKRNEVKHRLGVVTGWKQNLYDSNKIKTFALTTGCNTGRFKHRGVVNVPKCEVYFGKEMRDLFIAPDGYVLVGCDASQLEARIEGHFSYKYDGGVYAQFLLTQDIHQFNADRWGITRQQAKSPGYALAYQCGPQKIADLLNCSLSAGIEIHTKYWDDRPALGALVSDLEKSVVARKQARQIGNGIRLDLSTKPYIKGIDGRKLFVRSSHSLKNTLIQNAGMVAVKLAVIEIAKNIDLNHLDARIAMIYHDEVQIITKPEDAETLKKICEDAFIYAGEALKLNIPLKGEAKVGTSWASTH